FARAARRRLIPHRMIAGIAFLIAVCLFRLLPVFLGMTIEQPHWIFNFSRMAASCLCSAACLPRRWAIVLPFAALLGTDLVLNWHYAQSMNQGFHLINVMLVAKTIAFIAIAAFGWQLRGQARARVLIPTAIGSSIFFYIITNTAS